MIWEPEYFKLEESSVWNFPDRGRWATHDSSWRGNWSPYIPRNIILRYSEEKDFVLDQFLGGGTTAIEARLLNRNFIGYDINKKSIETTIQKVNFKINKPLGKVYFKLGDARNLKELSNNSIDLICTHPPYADIIKYSENIDEDLSRLEYSDFLFEMKKVASESFRVLKSDKYCAVLIGDIRKKGLIKPLGFEVMNVFLNKGFEIKEIILKVQNNCKRTEYWLNKKERNFYLIAHEYLFIFIKSKSI